jgi:hypothetical protein
VSIPTPLPGLVVRYSYLWADDAADGHEEGDKDRPAAVVMTTVDTVRGETRAYVLAITHSAPTAGQAAIEVPADVARRAGLDAGRHWVVLDEFNDFLWPGFDLRHVPNKAPKTVAYGFLTPGFFTRVRDAWLALDVARKTTPVPRD